MLRGEAYRICDFLLQTTSWLVEHSPGLGEEAFDIVKIALMPLLMGLEVEGVLADEAAFCLCRLAIMPGAAAQLGRHNNLLSILAQQCQALDVEARATSPALSALARLVSRSSEACAHIGMGRLVDIFLSAPLLTLLCQTLAYCPCGSG